MNKKLRYEYEGEIAQVKRSRVGGNVYESHPLFDFTAEIEFITGLTGYGAAPIQTISIVGEHPIGKKFKVTIEEL